jgi:hypothetical protein
MKPSASTLNAMGLLLTAYVLVLIPMFFFGPYDLEEWPNSIWSTLQYVSAIWRGELPAMWSDSLGLGTPLPLGNRLDLSPPFFLYPILSFKWVHSLFYAFYLGIASIYVWRICLDFRLNLLLRSVVGITFLWSSSTIQLMYSDDWPTVFHDWCLLPALFFYLRRLLLAQENSLAIRNMILLGICGGIWFLNGHLGHMATLSTSLSVYALIMISRRASFKLVGSLVIAILISSEHLYYLVSETISFPPEIFRNSHGGLTREVFVNSLLRPLDNVRYDLFLSDPNFSWAQLKTHFWYNYFASYELRIPFYGTLFFLASIIWSIREIFRGFKCVDTQNERLAIAVAFLSSLLLMFSNPAWLFNIPSATWQFRDGTIFFGLLSAALFIQTIVNRQIKYVRWLPILLTFQMLQVILGTYPALHKAMTNDSKRLYENYGRTNGLTGFILQHATTDTPRLFISSEIMCQECALTREGIYGLTDLTFFGIQPFTSRFKAVSMDLISKSPYLGYGWIPGHPDILKNTSMLNVFGINMILAATNQSPSDIKIADYAKNPGISEDEMIRRYVLLDKRQIILNNYPNSSKESLNVSLYKNQDAWPKSFLMDPVVLEIDIKDKACDYDGVICTDFTKWKEYLLHDSVSVSGKNGSYTVKITPASVEKLFVTSKLYRDEWRAYSDLIPLKVEKIGGALVGVMIPPNVGEIQLIFQPTTRYYLLAVSLFSLLMAFLALFFWKVDPRRTKS